MRVPCHPRILELVGQRARLFITSQLVGGTGGGTRALEPVKTTRYLYSVYFMSYAWIL